jgi:hypothetical protein
MRQGATVGPLMRTLVRMERILVMVAAEVDTLVVLKRVV